MTTFCDPGTLQRHPHNHELCLRDWPPEVVNEWVARGSMQVRVQLMSDSAVMPSVAYPGDGGLDLAACETVTIPPGALRKVNIDVAVQMPGGYGALFLGRSSMANRGLIILPTLIDWGFRGPLFAIVHNINPYDETGWQTIKEGDRIAQLLLLKTDLPLMTVVEVDQLDSSVRGVNGVGSSGR